MAKVTVYEIENLGFTSGMFGLDDNASLKSYITDIVDEVSPFLNGILGSAYDSVTQPVSGRVKRAEKCLVAAEMLQRRINRQLSNVTGTGQEMDTSNEKEQMGRYLEEARELIDMLIGGTGFSFSALNTSHFSDTSEISGLEVFQ